MTKVKPQIVIVHSGNFFNTRAEYVASLKAEEISRDDLFRSDAKRWKDNLSRDLGDVYDVFLPEMPSADDAKYVEWKIRFDKVTFFLKDGVILIGHSLGGIFLARYLSENILPVKIKAVFLVAAPYFKADKKKGMNANAGFTLSGNFKKLEGQTNKIFVFHSKDDPVVEVKHAHMYASMIPLVQTVLLNKYGHFKQDHFVELIKEIQSL